MWFFEVFGHGRPSVMFPIETNPTIDTYFFGTSRPYTTQLEAEQRKLALQALGYACTDVVEVV